MPYSLVTTLVLPTNPKNKAGLENCAALLKDLWQNDMSKQFKELQLSVRQQDLIYNSSAYKVVNGYLYELLKNSYDFAASKWVIEVAVISEEKILINLTDNGLGFKAKTDLVYYNLERQPASFLPDSGRYGGANICLWIAARTMNANQGALFIDNTIDADGAVSGASIIFISSLEPCMKTIEDMIEIINIEKETRKAELRYQIRTIELQDDVLMSESSSSDIKKSLITTPSSSTVFLYEAKTPAAFVSPVDERQRKLPRLLTFSPVKKTIVTGALSEQKIEEYKICIRDVKARSCRFTL